MRTLVVGERHTGMLRTNDVPRCSHSPRRCSDSGDTLIEILLTVTILSLSAVALLGAFASDLSGAARYKNSSAIEATLKNFAEDATYEIQYQATPSPLFTACATLTGSATSSSSTIYYNGSATPLSYLPPAGITINVVSIQYLYQNGTAFLSAPSCTAGQLEPQLITVTATGPSGTSSSLSFVVASTKYESYVQPS